MRDWIKISRIYQNGMTQCAQQSASDYWPQKEIFFGLVVVMRIGKCVFLGSKMSATALARSVGRNVGFCERGNVIRFERIGDFIPQSRIQF